MELNRPFPPPVREKLDKALARIDEINASDPKKISLPGDGGSPKPYRTLYSDWVSDWVRKLDPKASDELLILAKGRSVESWKLADIKRDGYSPNSQGMRQYEYDRKAWLADRLEGIMKDAGYEGESLKLVREVMLNRNIPDPRDIRRFDLTGPMGSINYTLLEEAYMIQVLRDADALVFMERTFPQASSQMGADEVMKMLKKEIGLTSNRCLTLILNMPSWSEVQLKMITKALPPTNRLRGIMLAAEGTAASSSHPGDWRFKDFQYD